MIIRRTKDIRPSEITPYSAYLNRRQLIGAGTALSLGSLLARTVRADTRCQRTKSRRRSNM